MKKLILILTIFILATAQIQAKNKDSEQSVFEYLNISWWEKFDDECLKENLLSMFSNNYDLKNSILKIKESEKLVQMQLSQELPFVNVSADFNRDLQAPRQQFGSMMIPKFSQYNYYLPLSAGYEIDIWQQNRLKTKSQKQELEINKESQRALYISLTSDFAAEYYNLVKIEKLLELQNQIVEIQKNIVDKTQEKYKIGLTSIDRLLDEQKYLTVLEEELNRYQFTKDVLIQSLNVYLADIDGEIPRIKYDEVKLLDNIPEKYSSLVIEKRPDFLQREANIKKIGFDIQVAKREFLPKFTLIGQIGLNAYHLDSLFNRSSQFLNLGILPSMDLFSGGRKLAFLKLKKYEYERALNDYQKTTLEALKDVNCALFEYKKQKDNYIKTKERYLKQTEIYKLASDKNKIGASSELDTLYAKKEKLTVQKQETEQKINTLISIIGLYKAVGGVDLYTLSDNI